MEPGEQQAVVFCPPISVFVMPEVGSQGLREQSATACCDRGTRTCPHVQASSCKTCLFNFCPENSDMAATKEPVCGGVLSSPSPIPEASSSITALLSWPWPRLFQPPPIVNVNCPSVPRGMGTATENGQGEKKNEIMVLSLSDSNALFATSSLQFFKNMRC